MKLPCGLLIKVEELLCQRKTTEVEQLIRKENLSDEQIYLLILCLTYDNSAPLENTINEYEYARLVRKVYDNLLGRPIPINLKCDH